MRILIAAFIACTVAFAGMACAHAAPQGQDAVEPGAVDLNQATESDLIALPFIGPAKASAIIAYRKKHGAFTRVDDLRRVRGFGRKTVADLRTMVTVARPPDVVTKPPQETPAP